MVCQAPEGERFELTLGDHDGDVHVAEKPRVDARHDVQHIGSAGWAEVLLPGFEVAGGIEFEVRMVPAQSILSDLFGVRMGVRDDDPRMVAALAADDLAAGEGIDSPEPSLEGQAAVDPTRLQFREVLDGQLGSDGSGAASRDSVSARLY